VEKNTSSKVQLNKFFAIMSLGKSFYSLAVVGTSTFALMDIPERGRGGKAWNSGINLQSSQPQYWNAKIDHFDESSNATYVQRYYVDNQYWNGEGPVFLQIGGEGTLSGAPGGYQASLAKNYSALLIGLEHRFYGESIPNGNVLSENYQYLTVEQALADLATFTEYYKVTK
jgi:hypothetical protein